MTDCGPDLFRLAQQGDREAAEKLIEQNQGLVWSIVRRYLGRGVETDDLYQLGVLGLIKAIQGYDQTLGTAFSTYAVPKIAGEIRRFLRDDGLIKVSRGIKESAWKISRAKDALEQKLGREPHLSELSQHTGLPVEEIAVCEIALQQADSLQRCVGEGGMALEHMLGDDGMEETVVERVTIRQAVEKLPEKERAVIALRYQKGLTQEKAARVLGVSQVQVSRLERRAIDRLRRTIAG